MLPATPNTLILHRCCTLAPAFLLCSFVLAHAADIIRAKPPTAVKPPEPPYLGQPVPGLTPERFAPGIVCTKSIELNSVFSPDGREFYFTRLVGGVDTDTMHRITFAAGKWGQARELLLFPSKARVESADMVLSADGHELCFLARHTNAITGPKPNHDIWVSRRVTGDWSEARLVGPPISTAANELYPRWALCGSWGASTSNNGRASVP
jgi:hypothetical protein